MFATCENRCAHKQIQTRIEVSRCKYYKRTFATCSELCCQYRFQTSIEWLMCKYCKLCVATCSEMCCHYRCHTPSSCRCVNNTQFLQSANTIAHTSKSKRTWSCRCVDSTNSLLWRAKKHCAHQQFQTRIDLPLCKYVKLTFATCNNHGARQQIQTPIELLQCRYNKLVFSPNC